MVVFWKILSDGVIAFFISLKVAFKKGVDDPDLEKLKTVKPI